MSRISSNQKAVVVRDLVKRFDTFTAVNRISFDVSRGEVFGFLGPNGAGKSTTIRMLCGILVPTSGQGTVAGYDILTQTEAIKSNIGYMSQKFSLYEDLTVEENIDFYGGIYRIPRAKRKERKEWVLEMAGLRQHLDFLPAILPVGVKQRLALGCALLHQPQILFLDEPTAGVDPINRRRFWDLIYELSEEGVTVFVTTHYMDEAENCDRLALIYRGEIIACETPEQLKSGMKEAEVLEVSCDRPQDALGELEKMEEVEEALLFGKGLHVAARAGRGAEDCVRHRLQSAGFEEVRIEKIAPSLEDVFVSLIKSRDRTEKPLEEVRR